MNRLSIFFLLSFQSLTEQINSNIKPEAEENWLPEDIKKHREKQVDAVGEIIGDDIVSKTTRVDMILQNVR